ncbi:hypothetical protein ABZ636_03705 [Streptomyces sp. NPDC007251]
MDRLNHISLWWIVPALIAGGAIVGGAFEASRCAVTWLRGRQR